MKQLEKEYEELKASGMMWEFFPEFTGDWNKDKKMFQEFKKKQRKFLKLKANATATN